MCKVIMWCFTKKRFKAYRYDNYCLKHTYQELIDFLGYTLTCISSIYKQIMF